MKKFFFVFLLFLYLSFNLLSIPSMAQPKTIKEGVYRAEDLNLSENMTHTIKNPSNYSVFCIEIAVLYVESLLSSCH